MGPSTCGRRPLPRRHADRQPRRLSDRARETLASVALVAAEDTRRTGRLLRRLDLRDASVSMFEGNEDARAVELVERLDAGDDVAVVTDGGMPGVSDPGYRVVRRAMERGIDVRVVPGPSAAIAALVLSGLPTDRFVFEGFLRGAPAIARRRLQALRHDPRTIVFFESPRRVPTLLREIGGTLGPPGRGLPGADEAPRGGPPRQRREVLASLGERALEGRGRRRGRWRPRRRPPDPRPSWSEVGVLVAEASHPRRGSRGGGALRRERQRPLPVRGSSD